jgi:hypothetical protein
MSMEFEIYDKTISSDGTVTLKPIIQVNGSNNTLAMMQIMQVSFPDVCCEYIGIEVSDIQEWFYLHDHEESVGKFLDGIDHENPPCNLYIQFS